MKHLKTLKKYFWKYRVRLGIGSLFIIISNYFGVLSPQITGFVIDFVQQQIKTSSYHAPAIQPKYDWLVLNFIGRISSMSGIATVVAICGITILVLALLRGFFMFLMR